MRRGRRGGRGCSRPARRSRSASRAWLFYDNVRDQIDANKPVAVDDYNGILEQKAVNLIVNDGFEPNVRRLPNGDVAEGYVFDQEPDAGTRLPKGSMVTMLVSSGKHEVSVPSVVGQVARHGGEGADAALGLDATCARCNPTSRPAR